MLRHQWQVFQRGSFFNPIIRTVLVASKAIQELELGSPMPLAKYSAALLAIFSFFYIRWTLCCKDMQDPIITGGKKEGGRGRGASGKKVLLETGADGTRSEALLHCE